MLYYTKDSLFDLRVQAIVNPVNCVGVAGKGLALQFKEQYPANNLSYVMACNRGEMRPGKILMTRTRQPRFPFFIFNFPTKMHWKDKSQLFYIEIGLAALSLYAEELDITSIGLPMLGCGLGGLKWDDVKIVIERFFGASNVPNVTVSLFGT